MAEATSENLTLKVYGRSRLGKSGSYRLRLEEKIPAIVYGPKLGASNSVPVSVTPRDIQVLYKKAGTTALITLEAADGAPSEVNGTQVLFKEIQTHPYKNKLTHVDLHQLDPERKVRVTVPLRFIGKAKGVAEGGILAVVNREVEIKALPNNIPHSIEVDVSDLALNETVHIAELAEKYEKDGKYEFIYEANYTLVGVQAPEEAEKTPQELAQEAAATAAATTKDAGAKAEKKD